MVVLKRLRNLLPLSIRMGPNENNLTLISKRSKDSIWIMVNIFVERDQLQIYTRNESKRKIIILLKLRIYARYLFGSMGLKQMKI